MNEFENKQQNDELDADEENAREASPAEYVAETVNNPEAEPEQPIAEVDENNSVTDETQNEPKQNDGLDDGFEDRQPERTNNYLPRVQLTPIVANEHSADKKGIRLFAAILAAVILVSCGMTAGYFFGKNGGRTVTPSTVKIDLAAKPKDTDEYTAAEVYDKVNESIVGIMAYNSSTATSASGVIYSKDGYIITNDHIYDNIGAAKFKVYTSYGVEYNAKYIAGDTRSDIAILKITDEGKFKPATFGDSNELYVGENVVAIGRPSGANSANNITSGIVSMLNRRASVTTSYSTKFIQTDSAINPGSSGGALLNMYGQVVGITSSKAAGTVYEGIGFAIPTVTAKSVADSLIENGYVKGRAKLGISYSEITSAVAEIKQTVKGLYIASIDKSSDLYGKAGIGDIITAVNSTDIIDSNTILDVIESAEPGETINLTLSSNGTVKEVSAKLIPDKGSSSYKVTETEQSATSSSNNASAFSFPYGN